jgi:CRP-like cAMP-binding protein
MYVIARGLVRKQRSHPALSEPAVVLELGPGESVGELGVLDLTPSPETVIALKDTDTLELSALVLAETMLLYPLPSVGLLSSLSRSVRTLTELEACAEPARPGRWDDVRPLRVEVAAIELLPASTLPARR